MTPTLRHSLSYTYTRGESNMMTVNEVSKLAGVSVRTLHYYDNIGLLHPSAVTESGYRLYDDLALERLQQILLFRELQFPLKEIKTILDSEDFDRNKALEQQIELLTLKKERLENLINFAREIKMEGVKRMEFAAFDTSKIDEYAEQAKERWGNTEAYKEYEEKSSNWDKNGINNITGKFMGLFSEFGDIIYKTPTDKAVQEQVKKLKDYITEHFYKCTPEILSGLGKIYATDGEFKDNIDKKGGKGTAEFVARAIEVCCKG